MAKRGGWSYLTTTAPTLPSGADRVVAVGYGNVTGGDRVIGIARDDTAPATRLFLVNSNGTTTDVAACNFPGEPLTYYRGAFIVTDNAGTAVPDRFNGSTVADLTGSPPNGSRSCIYKDRLVLANSSSNNNRIWFSGAGDVNSWDTTFGWIDTEHSITGLFALRNAILVFHEHRLSRIIGSVPPPASDMYLQPLYDVGMFSTFVQSLAGWGENCIFANAHGVFLTDGTTVTDLASQGGMSKYWTSLFGGTSRRVHGGVYRDYYICNVTTNPATAPVFQDGFIIHIPSRRWIRISNLTAQSFYPRASKEIQELYWGDTTEARVNDISGIFDPESGNKNDGDGTVVAPVGEGPFIRLGQAKGRIKTVYTRYDMRDAATDNPTLALSAIYSPEATSYTSLDTLAETTTETVARSALNKAAYGFALKFQQSNASSSTRLREFSADAHPREDSRLS